MNRLDDISFVIHARAREHYWNGAGLLSIKSFAGGSAAYEVDGGRYLVDDERFLVFNHGQEYAITIDSETPVESFCVFFASSLASDVRHSLTAPVEALLDDPAGTDAAPFFERTYPHDQVLSPALAHFRTSYQARKTEMGWLEEQYHHLMQQLLAVQRHAYHEVDTLPNARAATRIELYRRLHVARDTIAASYDQPLRLRDIAAVAHLSPNHLLRSFKALFGQTPYQYLVEERLRRARGLLLHTERSVTDICFAVGYESLGSFSWLFTSATAYPRRHSAS